MIISIRSFLTIASTVLLALTFLTPLFTQIPSPATFSLPADQLERYLLPAQDNQVLLDQEMDRRQRGQAPRFATAIPVQINPAKDGRWDIINDLAVWRIRLFSPGAHSLNLGFTHYQMPKHGKLFIYDPDKSQKKGPFTPADNESHNQLWTPVFPGDELIIEIQVPVNRKSKLDIELSFVNHDFLGFGKLSSGSCNLDIVCGLADGWGMVEPFRDVARSVGVYSIQGTLLCTGFLVNNTQQDCTPYFLTADHCDVSAGNAPSVVVYWNFENSTCRQPDSFESGQDGDGKLDNFNTGAIFRASWSNSDFCLIELDDPVSETANAYFAGWSAEDELPEGTVVSIHHPFTDEKRISFSEDNTYLAFWGTNEGAVDGNHIIVNSWTTGTTQSGSSGGPLFNNRGQAIGQLHGGDAACGNSSYDSFGRMFNSWEGGGTPDSRLKDWLDPVGLGRLSMEGKVQDRCNFSVLGVFSSGGNICIGERDTLNLHFGNGYTFLPEIRIGGISPELDILLESIPSDSSNSARLVWLTGADTPIGSRTFEIYTTYEDQTDTNYISLKVVAQAPDIPSLLEPADMGESQNLNVGFKWQPIDIADRYYLQLASDSEFTNLFSDQIVAANTQAVSGLFPNSTYYWRVAAENTCGLSEWSDTYTFVTPDVQCGFGLVMDTPIEISGNSVNTVSSELNFELGGRIASIEVDNINIEHDWIGDLSIVLRSPSGSEVGLLDRPGFPSSLFGCDGTGLMLSFNQDIGTNYQTLEETCGSGSPSISGTFQPLESLEELLGEPATGTWTLIVKDQAEEDGGNLLSWGLKICTVPEELPLISGLSEAYSICQGDSLQLELVISPDFSGEAVTLEMNPLPPGTAISFSENPATPGDTIFLLLDEFSQAGTYFPELSASDGLTSGLFSFDLEITDTPATVNLVAPADGASLSVANTTFSWDPADESLYRLEIATDPDFSNISQVVTVSSTFYTLELPEQEGEFFWRVIASNACGENISETFSFLFSTSAVSILPDGQEANIFPNPFKDAVNLEFTHSLETTVSIRLLDVRGRTLYTDSIERGNVRKRLSFSGLSAGIYLLEFRYKGHRYLQRLVKGQ